MNAQVLRKVLYWNKIFQLIYPTNEIAMYALFLYLSFAVTIINLI